ncbi:MAG: undecaprenyldiphospho-muramoylpentapeptide beta-N-acetylglucosaminyltransferase [Ignavibacteriales bacterium]|nr:undecaprenyldiphospho-muramoylpentapeptide beta-N-acetylglucosaminyltransferase [Ignavibacteriales bacterium]
MALRVMFAGGGTGGHLFPAIAIADELKKIEPSIEITFVGTADKIEARLVPQTGYGFRTIWISGFQRRLKLKNIIFPIKLIVSIFQTYSILKNIKPHVVVGTGGYVSGPVLRMAVYLGVPTLIQEQNSYPGVTTRLLAPRVDEIHLTFEQSMKYFTGMNNVYLTGNPTRGLLEDVDMNAAMKYFGFESEDKRKTILVLGGSLGAETINRAIEKFLPQLVETGSRVIWQTGADNFSTYSDIKKSFGAQTVSVNPFIERMDYAYCVADVVISRAGATTIAELTRLGKPAILVPYPYATADHQTENARSLAAAGAALVVDDSKLLIGLDAALKKILDSQVMTEMSAKSKKFGKPDAAAKIAKRIITLAGTYGKSTDN